MFRRRDPAAPADADPEAPTPTTRVELPRRVVDVPLGPVVPTRPAAAVEPAALLGVAASAARTDAAGRQLTVGEGIRLKGDISACDRLVVHGEVTANLEHTQLLEIARGGRFEGRTEVENAEIAGHFDGDLVVRGRLLVRSTGVVEGTIRFGELEIERGGQIFGSVWAHEPATARVATLSTTNDGRAGD